MSETLKQLNPNYAFDKLFARSVTNGEAFLSLGMFIWKADVNCLIFQHFRGRLIKVGSILRQASKQGKTVSKKPIMNYCSLRDRQIFMGDMFQQLNEILSLSFTKCTV